MRRHSSRRTGGMGLMAAMLCTQQAYASDTCTFSDNATTVVHAVGTFASDSPQHDFLTDWIYLSHPDAWNCTRTTAATTKAQKEVILKAYMSPAAPVDKVESCINLLLHHVESGFHVLAQQRKFRVRVTAQ